MENLEQRIIDELQKTLDSVREESINKKNGEPNMFAEMSDIMTIKRRFAEAVLGKPVTWKQWKIIVMD